MRKLKHLLPVIGLCMLFCREVKASPQHPDFLVIEQDTFPIYFLPLGHLEQSTYDVFNKNLQLCGESIGFTFNLWRGYRAYWQLFENKLYLVGIHGCSKSDSVLKMTFPQTYKNGRVMASWFSGILVIGKDELLKWDGIFSTTYFKEEVFSFQSGFLEKRELVSNYIDLKNGFSRLNEEAIVKRIFRKIKRLNWKKLSECDCDDEYEITIDENGKISQVEFVLLLDTKSENDAYAQEHIICTDAIKKQLNKLQFDIIKWHGQPYTETIRIELFYDKKLENWTF